MGTSSQLKANGARLSRLLIDKGTEAMRMFFDSIHPPAALNASLIAWQGHLHRLKTIHIINGHQWNILYPPSGAPSKSQDYDITLLFILLRSICGLFPPVSTGSWNENPPASDLSDVAALVKIKYFRNEIYSHITTTGVPNSDFKNYWEEISNALVRLGVTAGDISVLHAIPLEEDRYIKLLKEWKEHDDEIEVHLFKIEARIEDVWKLAKHVLEVANNILKVIKDLYQVLQDFKRKAFITVGIILLILAVMLVCYYVSPETNTGQFLFSPFVNTSNSGFVGRGWLFKELEACLNSSRNVRGVLIVGDPGSGKTAIMEQLIDSPGSSYLIHKNIIANHSCKFDETSSRDAETFVKKLVHSFAKSIPEFAEVIRERPIQDQLNNNCYNDHTACFRITIVEPLQKLRKPIIGNVYVLVDALDECRKKTKDIMEGLSSPILDIIYYKGPALPKWIKLILSSRNEAFIVHKMSEIEVSTLRLKATDIRNLMDIRSYVETFIIRNNFGANLTEEKLNRSINSLLADAQGNFLYVRTLLQHWIENHDKIDLRTLPTTLGRLYALQFRERFSKSDLKGLKPMLEVLLASYTPLKLTDIDNILQLQSKTYETKERIKQISAFLNIDEYGTVRFYHSSFAEWLMNQTESVDGLFIQPSIGHRYIADYFFDVNDRRNTSNTSLSLKKLSDLCMHVLDGNMEPKQTEKLKKVNVKDIWDNEKECILHNLARKREATKILRLLIEQFDSVDILNKYNETPAILATEKGNYKNVELFLNSGANANDSLPIEACLHTHITSRCGIFSRAIITGRTDIVELLLRRKVRLDQGSSGTNPVFWAVLGRQFEIIELLIARGAKINQLSLFHAALRKDGPEMIRFLFHRGARIECFKPTKYLEPMNGMVLFGAIQYGNAGTVETILSYEKDLIECRDPLQRTPLLLAVELNSTQMVSVALDHGANVEAKCPHFSPKKVEHPSKSCFCANRAIHIAVIRGLTQVAKLLLERNASLFSTNCQGLSAKQLAALFRRDEIFNHLKTTHHEKVRQKRPQQRIFPAH